MRIVGHDRILQLRLGLYSQTVYASWMEAEPTPEGWTPLATVAGVVIGKMCFEGIYPSINYFPPPVVPVPQKWEEITAAEARGAWSVANPVLIEGLRFSNHSEVAWFYRDSNKRVVSKGMSPRINLKDFLSSTTTVTPGLEFRFFAQFGN